MLFKGGTSPSKAFGLISRFSEDVDITVFRQDLGEAATIEELEELSGKKRRAKLDQIRAACQKYLRDALRPRLEKMLMDSIGYQVDQRSGVRFDDADPDGQTLLLRYPSVLPSEGYIRTAVRIECGAKSAVDPHARASVRPYVSMISLTPD